MESVTPPDVLAVQEREVTVTFPDGKQARAMVITSRVDFNRIDVTTEKKWVETQEREYINGPISAVLTIEMSL